MLSLKWKIALLSALAVLAVSLLWLASESHYRGCVEAAAATTAAPNPGPDPSTGLAPPGTYERLLPGGEEDAQRQAVEQAVDECSRSPF